MTAYRPRGRVFAPAPLDAMPVALSAVADHLRVDALDDSAVVDEKMRAAVDHVERETQLLLTPRACTLRLPSLPIDRGPVELPGGPVVSLTSISVEGASLDVGDFAVYGDAPAVLYPANVWPAISQDYGLPVVITYTAGYSAIPVSLRQAVQLLAGHWYANREEVVLGVSVAPLHMGVDALLSRHRVRALLG